LKEFFESDEDFEDMVLWGGKPTTTTVIKMALKYGVEHYEMRSHQFFAEKERDEAN